MKAKTVVFLPLIICIFTFSKCFTGKQQDKDKHLPYASLTDTTVTYVGMEKCITCHNNIHQTFHQTGMGQSWDVASRQRSKAIFAQHTVVHDSINNFYYKPFWKNDSLFIKEYRLDDRKDTIYRRIEYISFIVGSGQHTNSHIWSSKGYLYQAPITYYTQKGVWDFAPGFEGGYNSRWSRIISTECMNCHNMYSDQNSFSDNRFTSVKKGIECERCHGPGSKHVEEKIKGIIVDTSSAIDYTIVNPRKLPIELQTELCQRCHLQGVTVLNEGKSYYDFKPGMYLREVMQVYMPRYKDANAKFIMASHADRMKQSKCYKVSGKMTCITCHNPHVSVKQTSADVFNASCKSCHDQNHTCSGAEIERNKVADNCQRCHMPVSETLDIPHVTIHDHKIQIPVQHQQQKVTSDFSHLECLTQPKATHLIMAEGYLMMYEAFVQKSVLLDSAWYHLMASDENKTLRYKNASIQYYFWKKDFEKIIQTSKSFNIEQCQAWTSYRIGEAYYQTGNYEDALRYFNRAVQLKKEEPDFLNKKGKTLVMLQRFDEAEYVFEEIIYLQPKYEASYSNLSYVNLLKNNAIYALQLADKALTLNPDYEEALMNKVAALVSLKRKQDAIQLLNKVLLKFPDNNKARLALQQLLKA